MKEQIIKILERYAKDNIDDCITDVMFDDIADEILYLQLQQTGVKSSVSIELKDWDYECADGCCTTFGTKLLLNGKELEHPNEEILDNSYVGCDVQTALHAVLKELGYEVTFA